MESATLFQNEKVFAGANRVERTAGMVGTTTDGLVPPVIHKLAPVTAL